MQDYISQLLQAINNYDPGNFESVNHLRDLVCWISDDAALKKDPVMKELLYVASQKMRVFGYNVLNQFTEDPGPNTGISRLCNDTINSLYRSQVNENNLLDKSQKEIIDTYQSISPHRLLVSAPTSYGKTFLMREIVFLNKQRYRKILLVFPTVALLLENAQEMTWFVKQHNLDYRIIKTVDDVCDDDRPTIYVFTPERALQLISTYPDISLDFFFFDEVYKIDEDYCSDSMDEHGEDKASSPNASLSGKNVNFLDEDRGKTFRIALYLLSKTVDDFYLAGPNLNKNQFGEGLKHFIELNRITVKEILFEPTLRISVNAYNSYIKEQLPSFVANATCTELVPVSKKVNDRVQDLVSYIDHNNYGKTLLYCTSPAKVVEYASKLSENTAADVISENYPENFKKFIAHIKKEYDIENHIEEWSLIQVLQHGFGMHHGKLPKYIQREILDQFNHGTFDVLFCTSTIVEGVNTDAQNMIILNPSKGNKKLTPFDIKNIKGRAGRYYHCFVGRVFYINRELQKIESSNSMSLDFATYSDKTLSSIDMDNADIDDLTAHNAQRKQERDNRTSAYLLPHSVFIQNRTISKENQEQLLQTLMKPEEYDKFYPLITHVVNVEDFLKYRWIRKILAVFRDAGLIDDRTLAWYSTVANKYYDGGFKGLLEYEIDQYENGWLKSIDAAYSESFKAVKDILEHKIPKILSLFQSIIMFVAAQKGDDSSNFSLSHVRRYYETGVKSPLGEALIEYGFPTDAIRRIEKKFFPISKLSVTDAKNYCRKYYHSIFNLLDSYEQDLFIKAMKTF